MFKSLMDWYMGALESGGYPLVALMMAMESTIFPLPSELIIPFAAHFANTHPQSKLTLTGIVIAGALGSWVGAAIMYWTARVAGRPLMLRYGGYFMISAAKIEGAERWASHYGSMGIFVSRLLPGVRHLIGIPAGIVRMDFRWYSLATLVGAAIWSGILSWLGVKMGQDEGVMKGEYHRIAIWVAGIVFVLAASYYFLVYRQMKKKT